MPDPIRFGDYTESVRVTQDKAGMLAEQLHTQAPRDLDAEEKKALHAIQLEAAEIDEAVTARDRVSPAAVRPARNAVQSAWSGVYEIASAKMRLDPSSETSVSAKQIVDAFFPDGVPVAGRDAGDTYGISRRLIGRIEKEKLTKLLVAVAGDEMVEMLHTTTDALGEAIGAGDERPASTPPGSTVPDKLVRFGRKVGRYGRLLGAKVDEENPKSVQRFLDAVKPIDDLRASMRGGSGDDAQAPTPTQPTPTPTPTNGEGGDSHS